MKRKFAALLVTAAALLLTSCAGLLGPRNVELPLARLQQKLSEKFPFNSRYLELFDIQVSNPKLSLQPDSNRVMVQVDAKILPSFLEQPRTGSFTMSGRLQVDPERRALLLADPRMENFDVSGLEGRYSRYLARVGSLLAEEALRNTPLYTFSPEEFRHAGTHFMPTKITTRSNSLVVTFEPVK